MRNRLPLLMLALAGSVLAVLMAHLGYPMGGIASGVSLVLFGTAQSDSEFIRQLSAWGLFDPAGGVLLRVKAKTADYTILSGFTAAGAGDPSGTIFTNRGAAGTVNFTLPAPVPQLAGTFYEFLGIADFTILVKTATADTLIALNDTAADSVSMATAGLKIGGHMRAVCDGTSWAAYGDAVGITSTVAT